LLTTLTKASPRKIQRRTRRDGARESGVIDLASIMVGVIIVGILSAGITAAVFALVPWAQDNSAQQSLSSVASAESSQMSINGEAMAYDNHPDSEFRMLEVSDPGISVSTSRLVIETGDDGQSWVAAIRSATGNVFLRSSLSPDVFEAEDVGYIMAASEGSMGGVTTYRIPTGLSLPIGVDDTKVQQMVSDSANETVYDFGVEKLGFGASLFDSSSVMEFTIDTTNCTEYRIPVHGIDADGVMVDWGDGSALELITADFATHTYSTEGPQSVTVDGVFAGFGSNVAYYISSGASTKCTTAVTKWGYGTGTTDLTAAFRQAALTELVGIPKGVTDMSEMFSWTTVFNQPLGDFFDTSAVTDMSSMFNYNYVFNSSLGSRFDTGNVVTMKSMFSWATAFNQPLGDNFDTSSVTTMQSMFSSSAFNQPLGANFDTGNVTTMTGMFGFNTVFNSSLGNNFDTSSLLDAGEMFDGATSFNKSLGNKFDTTTVVNLSGMFRGATSFNQPLGDKFDTTNVSNIASMFKNAKSFNQPLGDKFNVDGATAIGQMFAYAESFNQPLGDNFDTSGVVDMTGMFKNAKSFNQPLGDSFDTGSAKYFTTMFEGAEAFDQDISGWDVAAALYWNNFRNNSALTDAHTPAAFR
jgi:type II secretory pathway pseudopilin PulG